MVFFNHATRQMTAKIVYYGPGLCGKTTNLNTIYGKTSLKARGEMVSLNTETDRTLFFDLLPMDVGMVGGFRTKLQLYTVPGQVFYNSTRKLVIKGVDGIVFVVDSQVPMLDACRESWANLEENMDELGLNLQDIPVVFQWNKRDLKNVVPVDELEAVFNPRGAPSFQSVASDGTGVFETLRGITKLALTHIKTHVLGESPAAPIPPAPAAPIPPAPAAPVPPAPAAPIASPPPAAPAPPVGEALTFSDLPSVMDLLDMDLPVPAAEGVPLPDLDDDTGIFIEAPHLPEPPSEDPALSFLMEEGTGPFDAEAFSAFQGEETPAEAPPPGEPASRPAAKADPLAALASLRVEGRRPAPKPRTTDPTDVISSLLDELTLVGRQGAPSVLRIEVPADLDGQEVEVVVQLRHRGAVVAEGGIHRPAPTKGSTAKLSVELKRS